MRVRNKTRRAAEREAGPRAGRLVALSARRSTRPRGTVLILVIGLLSFMALIAVTFLVTSRYDLIGTEGFVVENQAEMLFGTLNEYVQRSLTDDMWNHGDPTIAGDDEVELYDAVDARHRWLHKASGDLITWEKVVSDGSGWRYVGAGDPQAAGDAAALPRNLKIRYAFLIQDCNGLLNLNCHRKPGQRTLWDVRADSGHPEWGYWARDPLPAGADGSTDAADGYVRGMGPLSQVNLQRLIDATGSGESVGRIDEYFTRTDSSYRRYFDIQSEIELRFPGDSAEGSAYEAVHERVLPGTFADSAKIRRYVTAIARDGQWWPRRQPIPLPPYGSSDPWLQTRDWLTCNMNWYNSAEIVDHYYGFLNWRRMLLNPGFMLSGRNSAGMYLDWNVDNKNSGGGRLFTDEYVRTNEPKNFWLLYWTSVTSCHKLGTNDYHQWHKDWMPGGTRAARYNWVCGALRNFLTAGGLLPAGAGEAERMRVATQFHANYMDAVDPGDHGVFFPTGSGYYWHLGFDKNVLGIERQPYISEVLIRFASGGATSSDFAVELVNPYDTPLVLYESSRHGGSNRYMGQAYQLSVTAGGTTTRANIMRSSRSGTLTIPAGGTAVILTNTASSLGVSTAGRIVWDSAILGSGVRNLAQRLTSGAILELTRAPGKAWGQFGPNFVCDRVATGYAAGENKGIGDAFAKYAAGSDAVRLHRPGKRESRASQSVGEPGLWASLTSNLGSRSPSAFDPQVKDRAPLLMLPNRAFRYAGELGRMWRFGPPVQPAAAGTVPTERIETAMSDAWSKILSSGESDKSINNPEIRKILADGEAKLRYNPYAPTGTAEERTEGALLFGLFTTTGCAFDNVDSNLDGRVDEHVRVGGLAKGVNVNPWLHEMGNSFSQVGRINVNTAPRAVLRCLVAPEIIVGGTRLADRLAENIIANRPFTSMQDLLARCRTTVDAGGAITAVGFDYFGQDGIDNHNQAVNGYMIDGWDDPLGLIDDADEQQHLYTLNSEVLSVRSDTFAVYVRMQILNGSKIRTERRAFSIWDRSDCRYPQVKANGEPNADYTPPRCLATQAFGH